MALGIHDTGSSSVERVKDALPLAQLDRPYSYWERQIHALAVWCISHGLFKVDELRRAVEGLEPKLYESLGYYEKWTAAIVALLVEHRLLTAHEIDGEVGGDDPHDDVAYGVGSLVQVKEEATVKRWRRPHLRVPGYIHGVVGTVIEVLGAFPNPLYSAYGDVTLRYQPQYRVRFASADVWGATGDTTHLELDLFQHWLQPAPAIAGVSSKPPVAPWLAQDAHDHHDDDHHDHDHHHEHDEPHVHAPRKETECKAVSAEVDDPPLRPLATALMKLVATSGSSRQLRPAPWCTDQAPLTMKTLTAMVTAMDAKMQKSLGAQLVAKAWTDPDFKALLLSDPPTAAAQLGIATANYAAEKGGMDISLYPAADVPNAIQVFQSGHTVLRVVESTPQVHHLVVCTLCSCYPAAVLGTSPDWYKGRYYRSRAVRDPRGLLAEEFGLVIPPAVRIVVHDSTAEVRYLVLPVRPEATEGWSEQQLATIVSRDSMIGVAVCDATKPVAPYQALMD